MPPKTHAYTPLSHPVRVTDQVWPEGTAPLLCTSNMIYNHAPYIEACIEGMLEQKTTFPIQICLHDDASTDGTTEIIRRYERRHPGLVRVFVQPENVFRHPKRSALQRTFTEWTQQGRYIAMCEGDDYWTDPLKLQKQVERMERDPAISLCVHDVEVAHEGVPVARERFYEPPREGSFDFTYEDYFKNHFFHTASKVFRVTDDMERYHSLRDGVKAGDQLHNHFLLANGRGYYMADNMAFKRRNANGYTASQDYIEGRLWDRYEIWKRVRTFAPSTMAARVEQELADIERQLVKKMTRKGNLLHAVRYGMLATVHDPMWAIGKLTSLNASIKRNVSP